MDNNKRMRRNIMVYRLSALGDVAMTIPAIYSCAQAWPQPTFHVVTTSFCAQLFVNTPPNVIVHPIRTPVRTWSLLKQLNKLQVDAVADMHNVLRSWIVDAVFLLKGKSVCMMRKMRGERRKILFHKQQTKRPFVLRYFDVFERLGLPCKPTFTTLFKNKPQLPFSIAKGSERWIGIAPFARYTNKAYPLELMQQVARQLASQTETRVFLFGSSGLEAETMKPWENMSPRIHSVAGQYTLQQELSIMASLDIMVSMDSANMHLASLVGVRVVSVWGSTTPACGFLGYGQLEENAVRSGINCQPCTIGGSKHCRTGRMKCLKTVQPEAIIKRINENLRT